MAEMIKMEKMGKKVHVDMTCRDSNSDVVSNGQSGLNGQPGLNG